MFLSFCHWSVFMLHLNLLMEFNWQLAVGCCKLGPEMLLEVLGFAFRFCLKPSKYFKRHLDIVLNYHMLKFMDFPFIKWLQRGSRLSDLSQTLLILFVIAEVLFIAVKDLCFFQWFVLAPDPVLVYLIEVHNVEGVLHVDEKETWVVSLVVFCFRELDISVFVVVGFIYFV